MPYEIVRGKKKEYKKRLSFKKIKLIWLAVFNIPHEVGFSLDFDKNGTFVRLGVFPNGKRDELNLIDSMVIEAHTHPDPAHIAFPSPTDLFAQAKRSINSNSTHIKKWKNFVGPLACVFSRWGAVTYSYKRCKLPSSKDRKDILDFITKISAATKIDTYRTMRLYSEFVRTYGFRICLQSWEEIRTKGLRLEWESRRFHKKAKVKK